MALGVYVSGFVNLLVTRGCLLGFVSVHGIQNFVRFRELARLPMEGQNQTAAERKNLWHIRLQVLYVAQTTQRKDHQRFAVRSSICRPSAAYQNRVADPPRWPLLVSQRPAVVRAARRS